MSTPVSTAAGRLSGTDAFLAGIPEDAFLKNVGPDTLATLLAVGSVRYFERGAAIRDDGSVHFVLSGLVTENKLHKSGTMGTVLWGPGDILGLDRYLGASRRGESRFAARGWGRVLTVSPKRLDAILGRDGRPWRLLALALCRRALDAERAFASVGTSAAERINEFLFAMHKRWPVYTGDEKLPIISDISQQDIAHLLRLGRATVEAQIAVLKSHGVITWGYKELRINNLGYLRSFATTFEPDDLDSDLMEQGDFGPADDDTPPEASVGGKETLDRLFDMARLSKERPLVEVAHLAGSKAQKPQVMLARLALETSSTPIVVLHELGELWGESAWEALLRASRVWKRPLEELLFEFADAMGEAPIETVATLAREARTSAVGIAGRVIRSSTTGASLSGFLGELAPEYSIHEALELLAEASHVPIMSALEQLLPNGPGRVDAFIRLAEADGRTPMAFLSSITGKDRFNTREGDGLLDAIQRLGRGGAGALNTLCTLAERSKISPLSVLATVVQRSGRSLRAVLMKFADSPAEAFVEIAEKSGRPDMAGVRFLSRSLQVAPSLILGEIGLPITDQLAP